MDKGFSRIGKLVANRYVFPDDIVERDSAGPQLVLEIVQQLQLPVNPIAVFEFPAGGSILVLSSALASSMSI